MNTNINTSILEAASPKFLDELSRDEVLQLWRSTKEMLETAKQAEMEMRKYVVSRAFPKPEEGVNTLDLGNGYKLKAGVKFNYNLKEISIVKEVLGRIAQVGNQGAFIAERLVKWEASFLLTEFRKLESDAEAGSEEAKVILKEVHNMLNIVPAAPTLEIKAPKVKNE